MSTTYGAGFSAYHSTYKILSWPRVGHEVFTAPQTAQVPSGRSEHYLRGQGCLNGPRERDLSTGQRVFVIAFVDLSFLDQAIGYTRHFSSDGC